MNLTPGRGAVIADVGEAVATYWERVVSRSSGGRSTARVLRGLPRSRVLGGDAGLCLAAGGPGDVGGPLPRRVHQGSLNLFMEHPSSTSSSIGCRSAELPGAVRIMRDEMGPFLHDYIPGVASAPPTPSRASAEGWRVAVDRGHMGVHNWST